MAFYSAKDPEYQQFMLELITKLEPRFYDEGEFINQQESSWKEATYIMEGTYKLGYFNIVDNVEVSEQHSFLHTLEYMNPLVNDYPLLFAKRSDICYYCETNIRGFCLEQNSWAKIKESCDSNLVEGMQKKAIKNYTNQWSCLKRLEFPTDVKWFYDDNGTPHLGLETLNGHKPGFEYLMGQSRSIAKLKLTISFKM